MSLTVTNTGTIARELSFPLVGTTTNGPQYTITVLPGQTVTVPDNVMAMPSVIGTQVNYLVRTGALVLALNGVTVTLANLQAMVPSTTFPAPYATVDDTDLLGALPSGVIPENVAVEVDDGVTPVGRFILVRSWVPAPSLGVVIYPRDVPDGTAAWVMVRAGA